MYGKWRSETYSNHAPLTTSPWRKGHGIGVKVSGKHTHDGNVTVLAETISLEQTRKKLREVPAGEWRERSMTATADVIESLDATIVELQAHRDRLAAALSELEQPRFVGV